MRHTYLGAAASLAAALAAYPPYAVRAQSPGLSQAINVPSVSLDNLDQYIVQLHEDVVRKKVDILGQALKFTPVQAGKFWPIYSAYSSELKEIDDIRLRVVRDYVTNFNSMDDQKSDALAQRLLHFAAKRSALQQRYYEAVKQQLGGKLATRFLQVESRLIAIEDLQVAAQVPLLQ